MDETYYYLCHFPVILRLNVHLRLIGLDLK